MKEIEVKVLNIDKSRLLNNLFLINAKLIKKEFQKNIMFDYEDNRLFNSGGYIRLRELDDLINKKKSYIVTFKELITKDKFKISEETEFETLNLENTIKFLNKLGLKIFRIDEKFRESYKLDLGLVEIDTWPGVPTYIEVEAESEENIKQILNFLDYKLSDSTSMSLKEIIKFYKLGNENRLFSEEEKKKFYEF
jgi:adenylate cyclase class 2